MKQWIDANGGLVMTIIGVVFGLNLALSGLQKLCDKLKVKEPVILQTIGKYLSVFVAFVSANLPNMVPPSMKEDSKDSSNPPQGS